jgi:hypothetical protein
MKAESFAGRRQTEMPHATILPFRNASGQNTKHVRQISPKFPPLIVQRLPADRSLPKLLVWILQIGVLATTTYKTRGDCQTTRKSYKTSHMWVGLWVGKKPSHSWKYLIGFFNRVLEIGLWPHPLDEQCERVAELRKRKDDSK